MSDDGLSRRSALTGAGVIVIGGVAGYAAGRNTDAADPPGISSVSNNGGYGPAPSGGGKVLAKLTDIPDGGGVVVDNIVITRTGSDVHAFSATCTHQGCLVNKVSGGTIDCPCHGSRFDAATGKVVGGPAPSPLPAVQVTVNANGEVVGA
jgi:Rieske Fe-S protein